MRFNALTGRYHIYTLTDPRDGRVRYVGMTHRPDQRKAQHRSARSGTPMGDWLDELTAAGLAPVFAIIATANGCHSARDKEQKWIKHFAAISPLLNRQCGRKAKRPQFTEPTRS
jgi:hypothetical protein